VKIGCQPQATPLRHPLSAGHELPTARKNILLLSCEHGGREVPTAYATLFYGLDALLDSHRGWDPGALELGLQMAREFGVPLYAATTTRLLVELNRSLGHAQLFSAVTRPLSSGSRQEIIDRYYRPHRDAVEAEVARHVACGHRVLHIASHSFTPTLDGVARSADVAWLYDPRRAGEVAFSAAWMKALAQRAPALRLRRNYPYRGRGDGLTSLLRKRYPDAHYVGVELEVNQRFVAQGGAPWDGLREKLIGSLKTVGSPASPAGTKVR
jgi:predicted N-formylglutamate amidohydrolase